jgi:hypothetical protein
MEGTNLTGVLNSCCSSGRSLLLGNVRVYFLIKIENEYTELFRVNAGVPQGSVLRMQTEKRAYSYGR